MKFELCWDWIYRLPNGVDFLIFQPIQAGEDTRMFYFTANVYFKSHFVEFNWLFIPHRESTSSVFMPNALVYIRLVAVETQCSRLNLRAG